MLHEIKKSMGRLAFAAIVFVAMMMGEAGEIAEGLTRQQVVEKLGAPNFAVGAGERETLGYGARRIVLENGVVVDPGEPEEAESGKTGPPKPAPAAGELTEWDIRMQRERDKAALLETKMQGLTRDIRSAEQAIFRIRNQSIGLPPHMPKTQKGRQWDQYLRDEAAYKAAADKKERELKLAIVNQEKLVAELRQFQEEALRLESQIREIEGRRELELNAQAAAGKSGTLRATVDRLKQTVGMQAETPPPQDVFAPPQAASAPPQAGSAVPSAEETTAGAAFPFGWTIALVGTLIVLAGLGFMLRMQRG